MNLYMRPEIGCSAGEILRSLGYAVELGCNLNSDGFCLPGSYRLSFRITESSSFESSEHFESPELSEFSEMLQTPDMPNSYLVIFIGHSDKIAGVCVASISPNSKNKREEIKRAKSTRERIANAVQELYGAICPE